MSVNMAKELAALGRMTVKQLRAKHIEVFGEATRSGNKDYLRKRIAWRIQANAHGDLSMQLSCLVRVVYTPTPSSGRAAFSNVRTIQDVTCFTSGCLRIRSRSRYPGLVLHRAWR